SIQGAGVSLAVDDSADATGRAATIGAAGIMGLAPATINYAGAGLAALTVKRGSGGNTFTVAGPTAPTTLDSGAGNDIATVPSTQKPLTVEGQDGADSVSIAAAGLAGRVTLSNAEGSIALTVDDSADATGRAVAVSPGGITGLGAGVRFTAT